jgi:hypothetical protein
MTRLARERYRVQCTYGYLAPSTGGGRGQSPGVTAMVLDSHCEHAVVALWRSEGTADDPAPVRSGGDRATRSLTVRGAIELAERRCAELNGAA